MGVDDGVIAAMWKRAVDPARQEPIRRLYEDGALDIVKAIKRDYLPDMGANDGGQILSWLLDLVSIAVITELDKARIANLMRIRDDE